MASEHTQQCSAPFISNKRQKQKQCGALYTLGGVAAIKLRWTPSQLQENWNPYTFMWGCSTESNLVFLIMRNPTSIGPTTTDILREELRKRVYPPGKVYRDGSCILFQTHIISIQIMSTGKNSGQSTESLDQCFSRLAMTKKKKKNWKVPFIHRATGEMVSVLWNHA